MCVRTSFIGVLQQCTLLKQLLSRPDEARHVGPAGHPAWQEVVNQLAAAALGPPQHGDWDTGHQHGEVLVKMLQVLAEGDHAALATTGSRPAVQGEEAGLEHDSAAEIHQAAAPPAVRITQVVLAEHRHQVTHHALGQGAQVFALQQLEGALDVLMQTRQVKGSHGGVAEGPGRHFVCEGMEVQLASVLDDAWIQQRVHDESHVLTYKERRQLIKGQGHTAMNWTWHLVQRLVLSETSSMCCCVLRILFGSRYSYYDCAHRYAPAMRTVKTSPDLFFCSCRKTKGSLPNSKAFPRIGIQPLISGGSPARL